MKKGAGVADQGRELIVRDLSPKPDPEAQSNDPDIFNAVVSEQFFDLMLSQGVQNAAYPRDHADQKQRDRAPFGKTLDDQDGPHQTVNAHFDHDPRQDSRDMARRRGMGVRQPDMQRDKPSFHAKPDNT